MGHLTRYPHLRNRTHPAARMSAGAGPGGMGEVQKALDLILNQKSKPSRDSMNVVNPMNL